MVGLGVGAPVQVPFTAVRVFPTFAIPVTDGRTVAAARIWTREVVGDHHVVAEVPVLSARIATEMNLFA